jgi:hypothetical protein
MQPLALVDARGRYISEGEDVVMESWFESG